MAPNLLPTPPTGSEGARVATKGIVVTKGTELLMSILEVGGSRDESGTWPLVGEVAGATIGGLRAQTVAVFKFIRDLVMSGFRTFQYIIYR